MARGESLAEMPFNALIVTNFQRNLMHIRHRYFNNTPRATNCLTDLGSGFTHKTFFTAAIVAVALSACGKSEVPISTADRVKIVEEKQKTDPNFHLEKKATEATAIKPVAVTPAVPSTVQAEQSKASAKM